MLLFEKKELFYFKETKKIDAKIIPNFGFIKALNALCSKNKISQVIVVVF